MATVLADIGGTHARFARLGGNGPDDIKKLAVADYPSLIAALEHYGAEKSGLYIATAAWPHADGSWRFAREGRWTIDPEELSRAGWHVGYIGNDFGAGARGALALGSEHLHTVQTAGKNDIAQPRAAVLGSGTGLGLAYVCGNDIHETYGGQMEAPRRTDEQHTIIKLVQRLKGNDRPVSAEDIVSGPGLVLLYQAVCLLHGVRVKDLQPERILEEKNDPHVAQALRLYHEFLGLFAHQAVIYGHAFAALYLDGGVLHRLHENNLFDAPRFLEYFIGDPLPLLKKQMQAMAVHIVLDPYVALRGLAELVKHES